MSHKPPAGQTPLNTEQIEPQEDFLHRWSRRKRAAPHAAVAPREPAKAVENPDLGARPERLREEVESPPTAHVDKHEPPAIDSLDEHSDVSSFFSPGVADDLRHQVLRKLFHSAKFNVCDGLDDYAEDYTHFAPLGDMVTADMRHELEQAAKRACAPGDHEATAEDSSSECAAADASLETGRGDHLAQDPHATNDPRSSS